MSSGTVKLPPSVFTQLTTLKIRVANSTGKIPTGGSIIEFALTLANAHYDELLTVLSEGESGDSE